MTYIRTVVILGLFGSCLVYGIIACQKMIVVIESESTDTRDEVSVDTNDIGVKPSTKPIK